MSDINSITNLLSNVFVGVITLIAALGAVWLKAHLDNIKLSKSTIRQKAIEAYTISHKIAHALHASTTICAMLLRDKKCNHLEFQNYLEFQKDHPDTHYDLLEKLELLIIENFYDLMPRAYTLHKIVLEQEKFLLDIMWNIHKSEFNVDTAEFESKKNNFRAEIVTAIAELRKNLNEKYINK